MAVPRLPRNLTVRKTAAQSCYKGLVVGWIGDSAHQQEHSDHNPDSRGYVHALDFMAIGANAQAIVNWLLTNPADLEYVIHNRVIWTRSNGWKPRKYTGSDPHTNHVHASGKHGSVGADSATGNGYDTTAEAMSPAGTPCNPASVTHPVPPKPTVVPHAPGSRILRYEKAKPGERQTYQQGADVSFVQNFIGDAWMGLGGKKADGVAGPKFKAGVMKYQKMRGIHVDGVVGPQTWANMGVKYKG